MKKILTTILVTIFSSLLSQNCETLIPEIYISDKAKVIYETKLAEAKLNFSKDPSADNLIWLGRRTAYLGNYEDAIEIYSKGID